MAWIDQHLERFIKDCFPERYVYAYHECRAAMSIVHGSPVGIFMSLPS